MGNTFSFQWEIPFMKFLQSFECGVTDAFAEFLAMLGEEYLVILLLGICYWCINKKLGRNIALSLTGAMLTGSLVKELVKRRRPYMDYAEIKCIRAADTAEDPMSIVVQGYSLPSLHAAHTSAFYGTLGLNVKKTFTTILAITLPLFIGFARIYLGVHYPTDVLCGWAIGVASMFLSYFIERKYGYKVCFIIQLAVGALGFFYCRDNSFFSIYGIIIGLFFGFWYEEKYVNFEMSKSKLSYFLRPICGIIVFVAVSLILKLPVKNLAEGEYAAFQLIYRGFRYALSTFVIMGPYPQLFKRVKFL